MASGNLAQAALHMVHTFSASLHISGVPAGVGEVPAAVGEVPAAVGEVPAAVGAGAMQAAAHFWASVVHFRLQAVSVPQAEAQVMAVLAHLAAHNVGSGAQTSVGGVAVHAVPILHFSNAF